MCSIQVLNHRNACHEINSCRFDNEYECFLPKTPTVKSLTLMLHKQKYNDQ